MYQLLLIFHKDVPVAPKKMRKEQVRHMLVAGSAFELYCQKYEGVCQMFHQVVMDRKLSTKYVNKASRIRKVLETRTRNYPMAKAMSLPSAFEMQFYFHVITV